MSDCVLVQPISAAAVALLREAGLDVHVAALPALDSMRSALADARAVITRNHGFSAAEIAAAPRLRVIGSHGTGVDAIDFDAARARSIRVVSTPGTNAQSVAEHALALILACAKAVPAGDRAVRAGDFGFRARAATFEVAGRRLGLAGYGRIARRLAIFARALGMEVSAISAHASPDAMAADGVRALPDLAALCRNCDILSLHGVPGRAQRLDAVMLSLLPKGAIVVNTARGALIDEAALADSLRAGRLAGAALDVFTVEPPAAGDPLFDCPNLVLTPHIGGSTPEALERTGMEVARRVIAALSEEHAA